jgi:hypothetical protein
VGKRVQRSYSKDLANRSRAAASVKAKPAAKVKGGTKVSSGGGGIIGGVGRAIGGAVNAITPKFRQSAPRMGDPTSTYGRVNDIINPPKRR